MTARSPITTHVLDTSTGRPAAGVAVSLARVAADGVHLLATGLTNSDGRIADLLPPGAIAPGCYRLTFATAPYFAAQGVDAFYPAVTIDFEITAASDHYHVPLLVAPFGYSTYRGS